MREGDDDRDECSCNEVDDPPSAGGEPAVLEPERSGRGLTVYRLLPRTSFSWGNISRDETLQFQTRCYVPIETADDAQLVARVHQGANVGGGAIELAAEVVAFSADEPEVVFVGARPAATIRIPADGASGYCVTERLRGALGGHVRLVITFTRDGASSANTAVLSADLVLRESIAAGAREEMPCAPA